MQGQGKRRAIQLSVAVLVALTLALTASAATSSVAIRARLTAVAPARGGSGLFTATLVSDPQVSTMLWKLSVSRLSGPAVSARIFLKGHAQASLVLCNPCDAKAHGVGGLAAPLTRAILHGQARVVVTTKAHPAGELRGPIVP
jgi:hypothetical protein